MICLDVVQMHLRARAAPVAAGDRRDQRLARRAWGGDAPAGIAAAGSARASGRLRRTAATCAACGCSRPGAAPDACGARPAFIAHLALGAAGELRRPLAAPADGRPRRRPSAPSTLKNGSTWLEERPPPGCRRSFAPGFRCVVCGAKSSNEATAPLAQCSVTPPAVFTGKSGVQRLNGFKDRRVFRARVLEMRDPFHRRKVAQTVLPLRAIPVRCPARLNTNSRSHRIGRGSIVAQRWAQLPSRLPLGLSPRRNDNA